MAGVFANFDRPSKRRQIRRALSGKQLLKKSGKT